MKRALIAERLNAAIDLTQAALGIIRINPKAVDTLGYGLAKELARARLNESRLIRAATRTPRLGTFKMEVN